MDDVFNPDGRRPRRDGVTSASHHPELLSGDLAIAPRPYTSITAMNRSFASDSSRRTFGVVGVAAVVALLALVIVKNNAASDDPEAQQMARSCLHWHRAAAAAVSHLAQSTRDADLLHVNDSIFRMRRARRNCEAGWVTLACQDYHAVTAGVPGLGMTRQMFPCRRLAESSEQPN